MIDWLYMDIIFSYNPFMIVSLMCIYINIANTLEISFMPSFDFIIANEDFNTIKNILKKILKLVTILKD